MRTLTQPGPIANPRIVSIAGDAASLLYRLEPDQTLLSAITAPLVEAGLQGAAIEITGGTFSRLAYVIPAVPDDDTHVAYFSGTHRAIGVTRLDFATATFGWRDGAPALHCHGIWTDAEGVLRGGHILAADTFLSAPAEARAFAMAEVRIEVRPDPETNFPLLTPITEGPGRGRMIAARIRPNVDLCLALEEICRRHGVQEVILRGSLGSLVGAHFEDGTVIEDDATEILIRTGHVTMHGGELRAELDISSIDMNGAVYHGRIIRGENAVCITFEAMLEKLR